MKVDFSAPILDMADAPIVEAGRHITLGAVACTALLGQYPGENLDGAEKVRRFKLAKIASVGGVAELTVESVADIKTLIAKAYGPLVVGRAYSIIDPLPPAEK